MEKNWGKIWYLRLPALISGSLNSFSIPKKGHAKLAEIARLEITWNHHPFRMKASNWKRAVSYINGGPPKSHCRKVSQGTFDLWKFHPALWLGRWQRLLCLREVFFVLVKKVGEFELMDDMDDDDDNKHRLCSREVLSTQFVDCRNATCGVCWESLSRSSSAHASVGRVGRNVSQSVCPFVHFGFPLLVCDVITTLQHSTGGLSTLCRMILCPLSLTLILGWN